MNLDTAHMAQIRHLRKAPVAEAILDFRVRLRAEVQATQFKPLLAKLASDYPQVQETWLLEGRIDFSSESANKSQTSSRKTNGYFLRSPDGKHVAQFRLDGYTFSRLAPYTSWDEIVPEAYRLWELYRSIAAPEALYRIAVRYINHIPSSLGLPANQILKFPPRAPNDLPQGLEGFISQVLVPLDMPNTRASILQANNVPPAAAADMVLLDVDVFRDEELDQEITTLAPIFNRLREFKNQAFFGSLSDEIVKVLE